MPPSLPPGSRDSEGVGAGTSRSATEGRLLGRGQSSLARNLAAFLLCVAALSAAFADEPTSALRCGAYLISVGDSASKVLNRCGEPSNVEAWEEEFITRDYYRRFSSDLTLPETYRDPLFVKEKRRIEEWEYNFGSTRFIYYLRIENGRVRRITMGEYGY